MGNKLSTLHMASNSQDVTLEQFQYVIPSEDPLRSDVVNFPVKLVPVTKLLSNAELSDYNTFIAQAGYRVRFVVKIGKNFKGRLRFHAVASLAGTGADIPLPVNGKMPFDRLEASAEKLRLLTPEMAEFTIQNESALLGQRSAVVSVVLPPDIPGFSVFTIFMYILDDDDNVHLFTWARRIKSAEAQGQTKKVADALSSIHQRRVTQGSADLKRNSSMSDHTVPLPRMASFNSAAEQATIAAATAARAPTASRRVEPSHTLYAVLFVQTFMICLLLRLYWSTQQRAAEIQAQLDAALGGATGMCDYLTRHQ